MPSYTLKTFGCQMNVHDSERMQEVLARSGYDLTEDSGGADLVVINTCSVRDKAEQKLRSLVGTLAELKAVRPDMVIAIAGCVAQQEGRRLLDRMKHVDIVLGPDNIEELPRLVEQAAGGAPPVVRTVFDLDDPVFLRADPIAAGGAPVSAYVTIMKGCDERCSFCIVPHTRGPERYRPSSEIVDEIRRLVDQGTREVTLLGQTVNSYRDPRRLLERAPEADPNDADESEFAALLWAIASAVPELARMRYTSPHPRHVTRSLVAAHRDLDVLARHVHLPVQSGSNRMLKRMIRRYSRDEYVDRAGRLAAARPDMTLSTDVIVGFSGETDADFVETLSLVREVGFKGLFGFVYSRRPHTPALKLDDDVPAEQKSARLAALFEVSEELLRAHLVTLTGSTQKVLFEGASKGGGAKVTGRTERNEIVHVGGVGVESLVGRVVPVTIARANKHSLEGQMGAELLSALEREPAELRGRSRGAIAAPSLADGSPAAGAGASPLRALRGLPVLQG